ncbi:MAG: oligosaccharide flippase family protein [Chitinophagales bacterium]
MIRALQSFIKVLFGNTSSIVSEHQFTRDILVVFCIQGFALITSLAISLIITNLLGAAAYGTFSYGFSWVNLLAVFSCMGYEQLALKEIPSYRLQQRGDLIRGYFRHSIKMVAIVSVATSLLLFAATFYFNIPEDDILRKGLWLAIPVLPLIAFINLRLSWIRSFHFNALSQLPDKVVRPAIFLAAIAVGYFILKENLSIHIVIILSGASILAAYVISKYLTAKKIESEFREIPPSFLRWQWTKVAFSLLLVNGIYFYLSQLQIILLGSLTDARSTGIYAIASRLSDLEGYMLFAINVVLAPVISRLFAEKSMAELQRVITSSLRIGFMLSLPVIICFLFFPLFFLNFFGDEFGDGEFALILLTISQVVNFATGSVGYLLTMTGHHRSAIQLLILCALLTTLLSILLIPDFGVNGAAIASATNNIVLNVLMAIVVYRRLGINATLLNWKIGKT